MYIYIYVYIYIYANICIYIYIYMCVCDQARRKGTPRMVYGELGHREMANYLLVIDVFDGKMTNYDT